MPLEPNKILESYNALSDQARYGILAAVVVLVIGLDALLLVWPQVAGIADLNGQIAKVSGDTRQVLSDQARIGLLKKNLEADRQKSNALSEKVRSVQEMPLLLSTISSVANEYGVKIEQLSPERNLQETLASDADGKYYALPVVLKAHCGYHMFGRFLNKLEGEDMTFIVSDFIVQNDTPDVNTHLFSMTIKMVLAEKR